MIIDMYGIILYRIIHREKKYNLEYLKSSHLNRIYSRIKSIEILKTNEIYLIIDYESKLSPKADLRVIIYWIKKCRTNLVFFPLFSSLLKKREEETENELAKLG